MAKQQQIKDPADYKAPGTITTSKPGQIKDPTDAQTTPVSKSTQDAIDAHVAADTTLTGPDFNFLAGIPSLQDKAKQKEADDNLKSQLAYFKENDPRLKANREIFNTLTAPGAELNTALKSFKQAFTGRDVGKGLANYGAGLAGLFNSVVSTVAAPFTMGSQLLKNLPGGQLPNEIVNAPFEKLAQGVQLGQNELSKALDFLPDAVKNLGLDPETAKNLNSALTQSNQTLAQIILAGAMHAGTPAFKNMLGMRPDEIKTALDARLKAINPVEYGRKGEAWLPGKPILSGLEKFPPQLGEHTDFFASSEGAVSPLPLDIGALKAERQELAAQQSILASKINITEDPVQKAKLEKILDDRKNRINDIDKALFPGYEPVIPYSKEFEASISNVPKEGTNFPETPQGQIDFNAGIETFKSDLRKSPTYASMVKKYGKEFVDQNKDLYSVRKNKLLLRAEPEIKGVKPGIENIPTKEYKPTKEEVKASKQHEKAVSEFNKAKTVDDHVTETPLHMLPDNIKNKVQNEAANLEAEAGGAERTSQNATFQRGNVGKGFETIGSTKGFTVSSFPEWFTRLGRTKSEVVAGLRKIIEDEGKDTGPLVEKLKGIILQHLTEGRELTAPSVMTSGKMAPRQVIGEIPPDAEVSAFLQQFGDKKVTGRELRSAYNDFKAQHPETPETPKNTEVAQTQLDNEKIKLNNLESDFMSTDEQISAQREKVAKLEAQLKPNEEGYVLHGSPVESRDRLTTDAGYIDYVKKQDAIKINQSEIPDPANRGKGKGIAMYQELIDNSDRPVESDIIVSQDAKNVWDGLKRRGYEVTENPNTKRVVRGETLYYSDDPTKPVFQTKPKEMEPVTEGEIKGTPIPESFKNLNTGLPWVTEFINNSFSPAAKKILTGGAETLKALTHLFAPKFGVDGKIVDMVQTLLGDRNKAAYILDQFTQDWRKLFDKMPRQAGIDFIDNFKRGNKQPTPELQKVADFIKQTDEAIGKEKLKYKPSMPWKENHYRVLWKEIPGAKEGGRGGFKGLFRNPLRGSMGSFGKSTLADMSEGLAKGGVPNSYNPITMFMNAWNDDYKFITAQKMWDEAKQQDLAQFVRAGQKAPEGFVRLDDNIARVYFRSAEEGIRVSPGEYWVDEGFGRLLNNHLSRDVIRETALGKGMMWIKNSSTSAELALSPYHFVFESAEAAGSSFGLGMRKIINRGILHAELPAIYSGLKDILHGVTFTAPKIDYSLGKDAMKFLSLEGFKESAAGQKFIKNFPNASHLIDLGFHGGLMPKMFEDYKIGSIEKFKEALNNADPIGAFLIHGLPAFNEMVMRPMFDYYIPMLKWGVYMREMAHELVEQAPRLQRGLISEETLASNVVNSIENRFGEMNFDNLYWNRTLKTTMQLFLRSVTWKYGNVRAFGNAFFGQGKEFVDAYKERRMPLLHRDTAWLMGMSAMTAIMANAIQMATGNGPTKSFTDLVAPRINKEGDRLTIATYWKDVIAALHSPTQYIAHSTSGFIGRFMDLLNNKDFYGYEVYDPNAPLPKEAWQMAWSQVPLPFWSSQIFNSNSKGVERFTGLAGFPRAPKYIENTAVQNELSELYQARFGTGKKPYSQKAIDNAKRDLKNLKKRGKESEYDTKLQQYTTEGLIDPQSRFIKDLDKNSKIPWDVKVFRALPPTDQIHILKDYPKTMDYFISHANSDVFKLAPELLQEVQKILPTLEPAERLKLIRRIYQKTGKILDYEENNNNTPTVQDLSHG